MELSNDLLKHFWEMEETPRSDQASYTKEEKEVVKHFEVTHMRTTNACVVVLLPRKQETKSLGESRSKAVCTFKSLEWSLHLKKKFQTVNEVVQEYSNLNHAEIIPEQDLDKDHREVYYMPI